MEPHAADILPIYSIFSQYDERIYPPYCGGPCMLTNSNYMKDIHKVASMTHPRDFKMEGKVHASIFWEIFRKFPFLALGNWASISLKNMYVTYIHLYLNHDTNNK